MINGMKHTRYSMNTAWGLDKFDEEYEYSHVLDSDVDNLVFEMKKAVGRNVFEVRAKGTRDTNPFNTCRAATIDPWDKVENDGKRDLEDYLHQHCTMRAA